MVAERMKKMKVKVERKGDQFINQEIFDTLCKEGMAKDTHEVLDLMIQRQAEPNSITYSALTDGYCLLGKIANA
ncbi:hypothetical protein LguiA_033331 [Lonicera macranthoides]